MNENQAIKFFGKRIWQNVNSGNIVEFVYENAIKT